MMFLFLQCMYVCGWVLCMILHEIILYEGNIHKFFLCMNEHVYSGDKPILYSLPPGKFFMNFCCLLLFFKIIFFEKFFWEYHQSVKQFGSSSGPTFCRA